MTGNDSEIMFSPFETGAEVTGEKFIGREELIKKCLYKLKGGKSFALRGVPRIGKTSLAWKLLENEYWPEQNVIRISIGMGTCKDFYDFWQRTANEIKKELSHTDINDDIFSLLNAIIEAGDNYKNCRNAVMESLEYCNKKGIRTILCIDEFDSADRVFGRSTDAAAVCYYIFLRELITGRQKYNFICIFTSRNSMVNLTKNLEGSSILGKAVETIPVHGFNNQEMESFRSYAAKHGLILSDIEWDLLVDQAGRSPLMLSMTANELLESGDDKDKTQTIKEYEAAHYEYFESLMEFLREDNNKDLKRMIQLFIGPKYNLSQNDINTLIHSGYIWQVKINNLYKYETLSRRFLQYLREETRNGLNLEIWPLITETEKIVRNVIEEKMRGIFDDKWEEELINKAKLKEKEGKRFINPDNIKKYLNNTVKADRLIDIIGFGEYKNIIIEYKNTAFTDVFAGWPEGAIINCFFKILDARNPIFHSNDHLMSDIQINEADLACKKVLAALRPAPLAPGP